MEQVLTPERAAEKITALETQPATPDTAFYLALLRAYLAGDEGRPPIRLPYCSASPVCEIDAGYAAGVSDCREAIRRAGYPIEGDDER